MISRKLVIDFITTQMRKEGNCPSVIVTPWGNVCVSDYLTPAAMDTITAHRRMMA